MLVAHYGATLLEGQLHRALIWVCFKLFKGATLVLAATRVTKGLSLEYVDLTYTTAA